MLSFDNQSILKSLMVLGGEESIYLKGRPARWIGDLHGSWILAFFFYHECGCRRVYLNRLLMIHFSQI